MKVIWLCNSLVPSVAEDLGVPKTKPESWITGIYEKLQKLDNDEIRLVYLFPHKGDKKEKTYGTATFISYKQVKPEEFEKTQVEEFVSVLKRVNPDVVHIFGTEYAHSYAMVKACKMLGMEKRVVISIQGLVSIYAKHYGTYLPEAAVHTYTLRDFLRHDNIYWQSKKFERRGKYEIKALENAGHVIGRTDWDYACVRRLNPDAQYHFCNETLRGSFYEHQWDIDTCEKHSIFVSQLNYPIKGFHLMLEAMADVVKFYPDASLYVTGYDIKKLSFLKRLRLSYYRIHIDKLVKKYNLEKHVHFTGRLNETQMCERFLKSHVFVCCSSIENESNAVSEAKILGVPVVSSFMGGVTNRITHKVDGYLYQPDAPYMLAHYIMEVFRDDENALRMSQAAREHIRQVVDPQRNFDRLLEIYHIVKESHVSAELEKSSR